MSIDADCYGCMMGEHEKHVENFNNHQPGLIGGTYCHCPGDCEERSKANGEALMKALGIEL